VFRWVQTLFVVGVAALTLPGAAFAKPVAGQARIAINWEAHNADFSRTADRDDVVVLHEWEQARLRALKAANPSITVLMIKNLSSMTPAEFGNAGTGISTQQAADHPEWYLLNTSGKRFTFNDYDYLWAADIGNRDYQVRWAANVAAKLKADPWDGVLVDDANPTMEYHYPVGAVAKYPTDEAYQQATGSALALIGPRLRAQGKLVVANFGSWRVFRSAVTPWLKYVSGGMEEHFTKYGESPREGYFTDADWDNLLGLLKETQATGKLFLGISHSSRTDRAAARYGWATMLLAANGSASFALHEDYTRETWFPEYGYDLGAPRGKESELSGGLHRRAFERGLVLVNPTKASVPVRFGGRYRGSGLRAARGTVMRPHTGLVLLAVNPKRSREASSKPHRRRVARRSVRVRVACRHGARPCRRQITVAVRARGRRVVVGQRRVKLHRTTRVRVRISAKGHAALERGRRLKIVVRARH
jgi:hypothetical protein